MLQEGKHDLAGHLLILRQGIHSEGSSTRKIYAVRSVNYVISCFEWNSITQGVCFHRNILSWLNFDVPCHYAWHQNASTSKSAGLMRSLEPLDAGRHLGSQFQLTASRILCVHVSTWVAKTYTCTDFQKRNWWLLKTALYGRVLLQSV